MTEPSITTRFLARLLADSVAGNPDELAAQLVDNDARLERGEGRGVAIAEELRRVEHDPRRMPTVPLPNGWRWIDGFPRSIPSEPCMGVQRNDGSGVEFHGERLHYGWFNSREDIPDEVFAAFREVASMWGVTIP